MVVDPQSFILDCGWKDDLPGELCLCVSSLSLCVFVCQVLLIVGNESFTGIIGLEHVGCSALNVCTIFLTGECVCVCVFVFVCRSGSILVSDQTSVDHINAIGSVQHDPIPSTLVHAGTLLARRLYDGDLVRSLETVFAGCVHWLCTLCVNQALQMRK